MAAKKKSVFYHTRWNKVGLNHERAAEVLGVSVEQVEAWDIEGAPEIAIRARLPIGDIGSTDLIPPMEPHPS